MDLVLRKSERSKSREREKSRDRIRSKTEAPRKSEPPKSTTTIATVVTPKKLNDDKLIDQLNEDLNELEKLLEKPKGIKNRDLKKEFGVEIFSIF